MRRLLPGPVVEVDDLWDCYALPATPHLRAGFVHSVDGAVTVDGTSSPLSGTVDRKVFRVLRAVCDVVLVGAGTARTEDYGPVRLPEALQNRRASEGRDPRPALAVVTGSGQLDPDSRLLRDRSQPVVVVTTRSTDTSALPAHVQVVVAGDDEVDLPQALAALRSLGQQRILCEGGPQLLQRLLAEDAVDQLCLTVSPLLVGGAPGLLPAGLSSSRSVTLTGLLEQDGVLLTTWDLTRD